MLGLYAIALVPAIVGIILYMFKKEVVLLEWLGSTAIGFVTAGIIHIIAIMGMTYDTETWSGQIVHVEHHPEWVEKWRQRHSSTYSTGTGKHRRTHTKVWYTTEYDRHPENWKAVINYGAENKTKDIDQNLFNQVKASFGGSVLESGTQAYHHLGTHSSGNNNIYKTPNSTGIIYPATDGFSFENRVKAAPTLFSFAKVPEGIKIFDYPANGDWLCSDRLIGTSAQAINILEFDRMNSRLGPKKEVNVIMVGFGKGDSQMGRWQESKWVGGKKNDLVLCYGGTTNATWAYCFGWTEQAIVKRNLEEILMSNPIGTALLATIEEEIKKNYIIKDWSKFDYITIDIPNWAYILEIILMLITQTLYWFWAFRNDFAKTSSTSEKHLCRESCLPRLRR